MVKHFSVRENAKGDLNYSNGLLKWITRIDTNFDAVDVEHLRTNNTDAKLQMNSLIVSYLFVIIMELIVRRYTKLDGSF